MILRTDDVDRQVDIFTSNFISCLDACAPYVTKEIKRPFAPWMNGRLQEAMKVRDDIRKQLKFVRYNVALQEHYKHEKKQVKTFIRLHKKNRYQKTCRAIARVSAELFTTFTVAKLHVREQDRIDKALSPPTSPSGTMPAGNS